MCFGGEAIGGSGDGASAGGEDGSSAAGGGGSAAGGGGSGSGSGVADDTRVLRLPVSIKAGAPVKLLVRSPKLGVEEFSDVIRATQLAGFKVRKEGRASEVLARIFVVCPHLAANRVRSSIQFVVTATWYWCMAPR